MIESKTDVVKDITRWRAMPPELAASVVRFYAHYSRKEGPANVYETELIEALSSAPSLRREVRCKREPTVPRPCVEVFVGANGRASHGAFALAHVCVSGAFCWRLPWALRLR